MEDTSFFINETKKLLKPKGLDSLILYVTSRCNAKCDFCFYAEELNKIPELSFEEIAKVSKKLKTLKALLIGGGEPFLRTDLADIVKTFAKNCQTDVVQIPTNGFFTDRIIAFVKEISESCPQVNLSIQFSLDAVGEKHDEVRQLKNCFQRAEESIKSLLALREEQNVRLRVLVVSVLIPETLETSRELAAYVREKIRPDYHWFEPVRDVPAYTDNLKLSDENIAFLQDNLKYYLSKIKGKSSSIYASSMFNRMITQYSLNNFNIAYDNFRFNKKWPVECNAGKKMAVLYPDGILGLCELRDEKVNIRDYDFDINKALTNDSFKKARDEVHEHRCDCTHGCFIPTSVRYSPSQLMKIIWRSAVHSK